MTRKLLGACWLACALLLAGCGGSGGGGGLSGPTPVAVPNVVGQTQAAASTAITGAGLAVGAVTQQSSATVASGSVISESPAAGTSVAPGSAVALVVSTGASVTVPNVVGQTQAAAMTAIMGAGLMVGAVTQQSSTTVAAGNVISETPAAGTSVATGSTVALVVSTGAPVNVPNVVGQTQAAATAAINAVGLAVGAVTTQTSPTVPAGSVISENPAAGTSVSATSSVALLVSSGPPLPNSLSVTIDSGPTGTTGANMLFATVTVCTPGTQTCQQIDHVQIDTGSIGLSIVASVLNGPTLPAIHDPATGQPLIECVQYADGYTWGSMVTADVTIAGRTVQSLPVHLMGDTAAGQAPSGKNGCVLGTEEDTVAQFGANGVLGVGYWRQDCGTACVSTALPSVYYVCPSQSCRPTTASLADQLQNPVWLLSSDNNGILIDVPSVAAPGATAITGTLYFGVATQADNALGSAVFYGVDASGTLTTSFNGTNLNGSFIDSGSNGYFFASTITACPSTGAVGFYCPPNSTAEMATIIGSGGVPTSPAIDFTVDNADNLFANNPTFAVFPTLAGPISGLNGVSNAFDWGLPFFFGRKVFFLLEQTSLNGTQGPASAF